MELKLIFALLLFTNCYAQDSAQYVRRYTSAWQSINVGYKINYLNKKTFQTHFTDNYSSSYGSQLNSIVIEASGPDNFLDDTYMAFEYFIPTTFNSGDTNTWSMQGFCVELPFYKGFNLFYLLKEVDMPISAYWQIGSLSQKYNSAKSHNFFFNLGLRINPRVLIWKRLTLGIVADISWDVTKPNWKYKREIVSNSLDFKKSSYGIQLNIGWRYSKMQSGWMRYYKKIDINNSL